MAGAAARTVAAGSARVFAAWCSGTPVPEDGDRRSEGVADLRARRARVLAVPFGTERFTRELATSGDGQPDDLSDVVHEEVYDGAAGYLKVGDAWTIFFGLVDPSGPRGPNDPLWPLDALFGAGDDGVVVGVEDVHGERATRYRLSVDLGLADARLPAGVSVPSGPYRTLSRLPAEVWLDSVASPAASPWPRTSQALPIARSGPWSSCGISACQWRSTRPTATTSWPPPAPSSELMATPGTRPHPAEPDVPWPTRPLPQSDMPSAARKPASIRRMAAAETAPASARTSSA